MGEMGKKTPLSINGKKLLNKNILKSARRAG
jgi:hypothetical protein